jgi:hypothetical protein
LLAATRSAEVDPVIHDDRNRFAPVLLREPGVADRTGGCGAWFLWGAQQRLGGSRVLSMLVLNILSP